MASTMATEVRRRPPVFEGTAGVTHPGRGGGTVATVADMASTEAPLDVLVTGATGFIGRRLTPALLEDGHHVRAMTRNPDSYDGPGDAVGGDVSDPASLTAPLEGADVAVYLVHSLDSPD